jgi:hypothetical protein
MLLHAPFLRSRAGAFELDGRTTQPRVLRWRLACLAYAVPLLVALACDVIASSPGANAPTVFAMFELVAVSVVTGAAMCVSSVAKMRLTGGWRWAVLSASWAVLSVEAWGLALWLSRGLH